MGTVITFPPRLRPVAGGQPAPISPSEHLEGMVFVLAMAVDIHARETRAFFTAQTGEFRATPERVHAWLFGPALGRPDLIPQLAALARQQGGLSAAYCAEQVDEAAHWQSLLNAPGSAA